MKGRAFQQNFQVGPEKVTFQQRSGKNKGETIGVT